MVLHDRLRPGTTANIDHPAEPPTGVWMIDAKRYNGQVGLLVRPGPLRRCRSSDSPPFATGGSRRPPGRGARRWKMLLRARQTDRLELAT